MAIDIEQLRKDMEAGTAGPFCADFDDEDDFEGVPIKAAGREEFVPVAYVPVDFTDRTEREANARRYANMPDLEREYLALREAADALAEAVENIDPDGAGVYEVADRAAAYRKATQ